MMLFGWTSEEWAIAIPRIGMKVETMSDAAKVKREYLRRYNCKPGCVEIEGAKPEMDWGSVYNLFDYPGWSH